MTRLAFLAVAAIVAVIGTIALLSRPIANVGPQQSVAVPSLSASSSAGPDESVPAVLRASWIGATRAIELPSRPRSELVLSSTRVSVDGALRGNVRLEGDELVVTTLSDAPCAASVVGRYRWSVSPGASHLELAAVDDPCAAREAVYAGDWYRAACHDNNNTCWGDLDAGTYPTINFGPRLDPDKPPVSNFGAVTYTVPAGWTITSDHTTDIRLVHTADASTSGVVPNIQAWIRPAANVQTEPCSYGLEPGVGRTAGALAAWLGGIRALEPTAPAAITIDGHQGQMVDVQLRETAKATCEGARPAAALFAEGVGAAGPVGTDPWGVGITGTTKLRAIFLDLGSDRTVMILIEAPGQAFEAFAAEAMPIIESFTFE